MAVSSVTNRIPYQGDGTSAVFAFQYPIQKTTDIAVFAYNSSATAAGLITPMTLNGPGGTGYTVGGNTDQSGVYPGGVNVTLNSAPNVQTVLVLFRSSIITNTFSVGQTGAIPSSGLNNELDYLTLIAQRFQDQATRSARLHDGLGATFDPTLPPLIAQSPGKFLIINSNANGFDLSNPLGGSYIPNTVIIADPSANIISLGGAPAGYVLQSQGSSTPTWAAVSLSGSSVTGTLTLSNGGTGGLAPQQWGVVFASSATQLATTDPAPVGFALISSASSSPKFQKLDLGLAVGSSLPVSNGGTGLNQLTPAALLFGSSGTTVSQLAVGGTDIPLLGITGDKPTYRALNLASGSSVTGTLPTALGGTGQTLWSANQVVLAGTATQLQGVTWGAPGTVLTSQGSSAPTWGAITTSPTAPTTVSANYTALISDQVILANSSNYTITLYNPSGNSGRQITLKKQNKTGPGITIVGSNSFIDGSSVVLDFQYESIVLTNDGSNWYALDRYQPAPQINLVTSGSGAWSAVYALGTYYKTGDGAWRLKLNMQGTSNSLNVVTVILASTSFGVAIGLGERQSLNANDNGAGSAPFNIFAPGSGGSSSISVQFAGAAVNRTVFGDVALLSKPGYQM